MHGIVQRNLVTRVKGNEESTYRQGDVNLTPANLGAVNEDFSTYSTAGTPFAGSEYVILRSGNSNVKTDIATLASQIGGSSSEQTALVNYKKIISSVGGTGSFSTTFTDSNITGDMVLLEASLDDPSVQTSDWAVTCSDSNDGQVTISGSANGTTSVTLYFGVGMSTAPTVLTNLSSNSADNLLKSAPRPGVTGTLGLANGGTGVAASTNAGLLDALGAVKTSDKAIDITSQCTIDTDKMLYTKVYRFGNILLISGQTKTNINGISQTIITIPSNIGSMARTYFYIGSYGDTFVGEGTTTGTIIIINVSASTNAGVFNVVVPLT